MFTPIGQKPGHQALGMDAEVTRRDFLGSTLLASGAWLLQGFSPAQILAIDDEWTGYGGVGEYRGSNANTLEVLLAGHQMRDGAYNRVPADTIDTGETYDCVIVGGGISGLAAGFDARRDVAGIVLNRWGHAYLNPQPGFSFGNGGKPAPREQLRSAPFGRIAFANTDLAGAMDHRYSILEAQRAVAQLLDQVLTS
jgi:hypothetical protein